MITLNLAELAEICGIFAGDGTLYRTNRSFVLEVRGGFDEKSYYKYIVRLLFERLFQ